MDEFEKEMADLIKVKSAAALSSGTAAIHLALKAAGVGKDDIVFANRSFSASANLCLSNYSIFIDSD